MSTADSVKTELAGLLTKANAATGNADTTIHDAVYALVEGYGQGEEPVIEALEVTANGTYNAPSGTDGYNPVVVNVPIPDGYIKPSGTKTITENGTYDVTNYATAEVNVPSENMDAEIAQQTTALNAQAALITQLRTVLDGKAAGGTEIPTCTVKLTFALPCDLISYAVVENGKITSKALTSTQVGQITFENIVCSSPITIFPADVIYSSGGLEKIGIVNGNWVLQAPTTPGVVHEGTIEKADF